LLQTTQLIIDCFVDTKRFWKFSKDIVKIAACKGVCHSIFWVGSKKFWLLLNKLFVSALIFLINNDLDSKISADIFVCASFILRVFNIADNAGNIMKHIHEYKTTKKKKTQKSWVLKEKISNWGIS